MKIILVSHPDRSHHVHTLCTHLGSLIVGSVVDVCSARSGHFAALRMAAQLDERVAIMEDDAIPVENFDSLSNEWADRMPRELLSFYLGTGRPRELQPWIDHEVAHAREGHVWIYPLIHGVCYSVPPAGLQRVIDAMSVPSRVREADYAVGAAWGRKVCYPIESLVQHRDEAPVERHPDGRPRTEPRVARRLAGALMFKP